MAGVGSYNIIKEGAKAPGFGSQGRTIMKKAIRISILLVTALVVPLAGCTAEEPGYVIVIGNPEVQIVNSNSDIITIDEATRAIATIEYEHYQIHEGNTFTILEVNDLGNGVVRDILVVSPNTTEWAHLVWEIEHELETLIQFYQDTTYTDNGTEITSFNRNGNSTHTATTLVYHTPTITNVGTLIGTIQQGSGKKAGGSDRLSNEFILQQNTAYLIRITNLTVNNNLIFMKLNWYEHTNED